jgi:hypothetical protein
MRISDHEPVRPIEHTHQEMMLPLDAIREVGGIVQNRVDFTTDRGFRMLEMSDELHNLQVIGNDDQIEIALGPLLARGDGPEDESKFDLMCHRRESRCEHLADANGFEYKGAKLRIDGTFRIGAVEDLPANLFAVHETRPGECGHLSLHGARRNECQACDLPEMEGLIRSHEKQPEHGLSGFPEQNAGYT